MRQGVGSRVRARVERELEGKSVEGRATSPAWIEVVEGIRDLTRRGGRRLGPIVVDAAYRCVASDPDDDATVFAHFDQISMAVPGAWDADPRLRLTARAPRPVTVMAAVPTIRTSERA